MPSESPESIAEKIDLPKFKYGDKYIIDKRDEAVKGVIGRYRVRLERALKIRFDIEWEYAAGDKKGDVFVDVEPKGIPPTGYPVEPLALAKALWTRVREVYPSIVTGEGYLALVMDQGYSEMSAEDFALVFSSAIDGD